jgi:hypothetical protein
VPLQTIDPAALEDLKRQAIARAEHLGHRLQLFRTAKHDPLCYVSFCNECRQMVIVSLEGGEEHRGTLYGYALEARCAARAAATQHTPVSADTR